MLLDAEMDHGPVLAQEKIALDEWPPRAQILENLLAKKGGDMLATILPQWIAGTITAREQDHSQATICKMIRKEMGLIDLSADPYQNLLKIRGLEGWPGAYAFFERGGQKIRVHILTAHLDAGALIIDTVRPEGKRDMPYADFLRSGAQPIPTFAASS